MAIEQLAHADGDLLGGHARLGATGVEFVAAGHAGGLFRVLPFVCQCRAGFFRLPVRWNVAGGGIHCDVFRAAGMATRMGRSESAIACEPVPADMGRLADLFRIGIGEDHGRRPAMAELHRARRVLPERPAADVDRLVHAASAALVPCGDRVCNTGDRAGARVDDVSAAPHSNPLLFHCDTLADRDHSLGELYVSELPRPRAGISLARWPVCAAMLTAILEAKLPRLQRG